MKTKKNRIVFHDMTMEVPVKNGEKVVNYDKVMYIECDKPYCMIHCSDGVKLKTQATLQLFSDNLSQAFFQCNRATIVNLAHYSAYNKVSLTLTMTDSQTFTLSRRKTVEFTKLKNKIQNILSQCPCYTCSKGKCIPHIVFCTRCVDLRSQL